MRRSILATLLCPRCRRGALLSDSDAPELLFGPLRCVHCQASFPVAEGVADLVGERSAAGALQRGMELPWVARSYERYVRPAAQRALLRRAIDPDSEFMLYRALLGHPDGPVLDLCCGTGLFARRLARDQLLAPTVALDVSRPMLEEAVAQAREGGVTVDFVRAEIPDLPFQDASLGGVLQTSSLHLIENAPALFQEVSRVLKPGGCYLASTYEPPPLVAAALQRKAGLHPRSEAQLRDALAVAGLDRFERVAMKPMLIVRAEKAA